MGCAPSKDAVTVIQNQNGHQSNPQRRNSDHKPVREDAEQADTKVAVVKSTDNVESIPNHTLRTNDIEELCIPDDTNHGSEKEEKSSLIETNSVTSESKHDQQLIVIPVGDQEEEIQEDNNQEEVTDVTNKEDKISLADDANDESQEDGGIQNGIDDVGDNQDDNGQLQEVGDNQENGQSQEMEESPENEQSHNEDDNQEIGDRSENTQNEVGRQEVMLVTSRLETSEEDPRETDETEEDNMTVADEENIVTDQTSLPNVPPNPRPANFAALYGSNNSKWPIRNYVKLEFPVNASHGGGAALLLCSNSYGGKGPETTAEIILARSGFDCNHFGTSSIIKGNTGHFGCQNHFMTNEEGLLVGNLMFGTNKVMVLSNDCQYGDLSNGVQINLPKATNGRYRLFTNSNSTVCMLALCSSPEGNAAYMVRTGFKDSFVEAKLIHGDDKWKFDGNTDGEVDCEGPGDSFFSIYINKPDMVISDSSFKRSRVLFTQATDGQEPTLILDNQEPGVLMVLCSNSVGTENDTAAAIYMVTISSNSEVSTKLVTSSHGQSGYSSADLWVFESVNGKCISVKGPPGPCRYATLSNLEQKGETSINQTICLGSGEPSCLQGEVTITDKMVKGILDRPSKVLIKVNHAIVASFKPGQLRQVKDGYAFCREWKQGEITNGTSLVRVFASRKHVTSGKNVMIELKASPTRLITQKEGVAYALNCGGYDYTSVKDITYASEHKRFCQYHTNNNNGCRYSAYGEVKIHTGIPSLLMATDDGALYATLRHFSTEAIYEQKVHYDVTVPNGSYILRLHFVHRISRNVQFLCNGVNIAGNIEKASNLNKDFLKEHGGYTTYIADVPVSVTDNTLSIRSAKQAICAFALLDESKFEEKKQTAEQIKEEQSEKQKLMDTIDPLGRSLTRKQLKIVGWSANLLKNGSGEEGNLSHWNTSGNWNVCEGGYGTEKAFQTSHMDCRKYQEVDLLEHFSAEYLDTAPDIQVSEWYREGVCGGGFYSYEAKLLDGDGKAIKSFSTGRLGTLYKDKEWMNATTTFKDYGPGARLVGITSFGKDDKYWAGHYGPLMSTSVVRVKRETQPAPDDSFTDIQINPAEAAFTANRDKLVVKMFSDNKDLIMELVEDKVLKDPEVINQKYIPGRNRKPRKHRKREIRVFVSSTFKDFSDEREQLIKKTFREINKMCSERGVFFTYVDLRWGISDEQSKTGQTIAICLQEIDRCRPYFICMLGQRFGWSKPEDKEDEALMKSFDYAIENHPNLGWIDQYRDNTSVTQLEVLHGVLNNIQGSKQRSFFYLRDPPVKSEMSDSDYTKRSAESEWHFDRQSQLRTRVGTNDELNTRKFASPEEVCVMIKEDLEICVNEDFPIGTELTPLEREQEAHQAFGDARTQVYIGREQYFIDIDKVMEEKTDQPFVLLGESGSGKSALVANWVKRVREKEKDSFVFVHFIGSSAESASYLKLLRRLYEELKEYFDIELNVPTSDTNLVLDLSRWIKLAASRGRCVIVFDALNQLNDGSGEEGGEHDLLWIPRNLPKNVFMLLSTLPGRAFEAVKAAGWRSMKVEPLDMSQKKEIIIGYLEGVYSKTLSDEQKQLIIDAPQTNNPLYLRSLLDEVRVYGSFRTLTQKIQEYLLAGNPGDLFAKILERLEGDFEDGIDQSATKWTIAMWKDLVKDTTTAIWCSHRGMAEGELTELLDVPSAVWSPFYLSLVENLVNRNGVVNFFHDHLRQAVEKKYLRTPEEKKESFKRLADYFSTKSLDDRVVDELPFLLGKAGELERLKETISDLKVFSRLARTEDGKFELTKSWQLLGDYTEAEVAYLAKLDEVKEEDKQSQDYSQLLDLLGDFFLHLGLFKASRDVNELLLEQLEARYTVSHGTVVYKINTYNWNYRCKHPDVIKSLLQLGIVCEKQMELEAGVKYYQEAISRQNRIETPSQKLQLCEGLLGLATVYNLQENKREAKKLLVRCLELATDVLGPKHHYVAAIYNKLGELSYSQNMLDKAVGYFLQDLKLTRSDVGMTHPRIAGILSDLAIVYDGRTDPLAGQIYETALAMLLDTYGHSHVDVAVVRYNLGTFYFATNYFAKAKYQLQESYNVFLSFLGAEHPDTKAAKEAMDEVGTVPK
ncbi:LOW QUALITY PROTEIN: uncharacterized protein LOC117331312 [Pecten maximus]|uniref:LOW QUALITY PROTEIN: uncharacterized protein LOC117331312 n=1 Tax=Pecten maximus TaxID=6579 RepID=UPI0014588942|nr:LOW QUALITY PROTEIN: uncharacterized protein LOC117331312 [Pecten maximus]